MAARGDGAGALPVGQIQSAKQYAPPEQEAAADEKGRLYLEMRDYIEANYSDATLNVNALSEHFDRPAPFVSAISKR